MQSSLINKDYRWQIVKNCGHEFNLIATKLSIQSFAENKALRKYFCVGVF